VREFVDVGVEAAFHQSQGVGPAFRQAVSRRAGPGLTSDAQLGHTSSFRILQLVARSNVESIVVKLHAIGVEGVHGSWRCIQSASSSSSNAMQVKSIYSP
jgi:hypothetical protein